MKILCLFVRHGTTAYPESLAVLDQWYRKHALLDQRTLWILDNELPAGSPPQTLWDNVVLRGGDNRAWEFSTWAHAINEAQTTGMKFDVVHFVTSAFNTIYTGYLDHFFPDMLTYVQERSVCLGHIDLYRFPVTVGGEQSHAWIRSCFFFLPWSRIFELSPWAAYQDPDAFFSRPESREFRSDAPIDRGYQEKITRWLEGREIGGHSWHSPVSQGPQENIRFQRKTLAIVNEHSLAITLRKAGIRLTDLCWLHSFRATPVSIISDPPSEIIQESIRRQLLGFQNPIETTDRSHAL